MNSHIVRRGNHFIRIGHQVRPGFAWMLIDGPWFDYLNIMSKRQDNAQFISVAHYVPSEPTWHTPDTLPVSIDVPEAIVWKKIAWSPGSSIMPTYKPKLPWDRLPKLKGFPPTHGVGTLAERWRSFLNHRTKFGWCVMPNAPLPLALNCVKGNVDDPHFIDCLLQFECLVTGF